MQWWQVGIGRAGESVVETDRPVTARAGDLVRQIGWSTVSAEDYRGVDWRSIALVVNLDDRTNMFGYLFTDDDWEAATPGLDVLRLAVELREALRAPGEGPWKRALFRIVRDRAAIEVELDHEGTRWIPDMTDPEGFARSLQPHHGR